MIEKPGDVVKFDELNVPVLGNIINKICDRAAAFRYTDIEPTVGTVHEGEIVVYDDGAGTKAIYVVTGQGNLGYVTLT